MLEDPTLREYIAWSDDGKSFLVFNPSDFARDVLPRFFKHSNFSSFLRQVRRARFLRRTYNAKLTRVRPSVQLLQLVQVRYGVLFVHDMSSDTAFARRVNDALSSSNSITHADGSQGHAWEFRNPSFQRGRPDLLGRIKRKTAKTTPAPAQVSSRRRASFVLASSGRGARSVLQVNGDAADSGDDTQHEVELEEGASRPRSHGGSRDTFNHTARGGSYQLGIEPTQGPSDLAWSEVRNARPDDVLGKRVSRTPLTCSIVDRLYSARHNLAAAASTSASTRASYALHPSWTVSLFARNSPISPPDERRIRTKSSISTRGAGKPTTRDSGSSNPYARRSLAPGTGRTCCHAGDIVRSLAVSHRGPDWARQRRSLPPGVCVPSYLLLSYPNASLRKIAVLRRSASRSSRPEPV